MNELMSYLYMGYMKNKQNNEFSHFFYDKTTNLTLVTTKSSQKSTNTNTATLALTHEVRDTDIDLLPYTKFKWGF